MSSSTQQPLFRAPHPPYTSNPQQPNPTGSRAPGQSQGQQQQQAEQGQGQVDPSFWADQLFDDEQVEGMDMDFGAAEGGDVQMTGSQGEQSGKSGNWRDSNREGSPTNSPPQLQSSLPLEKESPAVRVSDDFGTSPINPTSGALAGLIPQMGASMIGQRNPPGMTPQSLSMQANMASGSQPVPVSSPMQGIQSTSGNQGGQQSSPAMRGFGSSPPKTGDLRRQVVTGMQQASPATRSHEPSPLGRYYLSTNDPQHISKHPQGSMSFPGVNPNPNPINFAIPYMPNTPATVVSPIGLRNRGMEKESPTLSLASDETIGWDDDFGSGVGGAKRANLFPSQPGTGAAQRKASFPQSPTAGVGVGVKPGNALKPDNQGRVAAGGALLPHQIPLPPSPHISGMPASPQNRNIGTSPVTRTAGMSFGGTGGQLGSGRMPASPLQIQRQAVVVPPTHTGASTDRPGMKDPADSFISEMSTSSEEEDISSPMVLPDTSLRASDRQENSPRSLASGDFSGRNGFPGSSSAANSWKHVQALGKMTSPFPFGSPQAPKSAPGQQRASFTFTPGRDAPVFPPMSPSSSSSYDSEMEDGMTPESKKRRFQGPISPKRTGYGERYDEGSPDDAGDYGHGFGSGSRRAEESRDGRRQGSITVGGRGYGDGLSSVGGDNGDEDSGDDDRERRGGSRRDSRLENAAPSKKRGRNKKGDAKNGARRSSGSGNRPDYDDDSDDVEDEVEPTIAAHAGGRRSVGGPNIDDSSDDSDDSGDETASDYGGKGESKRRGKKRKHALQPRGPDSGSTRSDNKGDISSGSNRPDLLPSKAKRRKPVPDQDGDIACDYQEPLPPFDKCTSTFHRTYDLARHRETIHARNEGRAVESGHLKPEQALIWQEFGRPQCSFPCPVEGCGQIFSRKDAMQRHLKTKRHEGVELPPDYFENLGH